MRDVDDIFGEPLVSDDEIRQALGDIGLNEETIERIIEFLNKKED